MLNLKRRCFPFAGLLTVHFRAGKIGRWLLSEAGGGGTHQAEQITHLMPDLRNNSDPSSRHPNKRGRAAEAASAQRLPRAEHSQTAPFPVRGGRICWSLSI